MKKYTRMDKSAIENTFAYQDTYNYLRQLTIANFKWTGLPNHIPVDWIERLLFDLGHCVVFNSDKFGLMIAKCTRIGFNIYNEPTEFVVTAATQFNETVKASDAVWIRNNTSAIPQNLIVRKYAMTSYEIERSIDTNIKGQKFPVMVLCDQDLRLTMENVFKNYDGNQPFIFGDKRLKSILNGDEGMIKALNVGSPFVADKLLQLKHENRNEYLTRIGVNNSNQHKKERLIIDEVHSNDEYIELSGRAMLDIRKQACKRINEKFGVNWNVELTCKEGEEIGGLHDTAKESN